MLKYTVCVFCKSKINSDYIINDDCPICHNVNALINEKTFASGRYRIINLEECIVLLKAKMESEYKDSVIKPKITKDIIHQRLAEYCGVSKTRIVHITYNVSGKNIVNNTLVNKLKECLDKYGIDLKTEKM